MTTSHSIPVLMRVISASLTLAKRAGQIIKDVQMSGTSLDIVDKVPYVFYVFEFFLNYFEFFRDIMIHKQKLIELLNN